MEIEHEHEFDYLGYCRVCWRDEDGRKQPRRELLDERDRQRQRAEENLRRLMAAEDRANRWERRLENLRLGYTIAGALGDGHVHMVPTDFTYELAEGTSLRITVWGDAVTLSALMDVLQRKPWDQKEQA
jgi:hypothetical protein